MTQVLAALHRGGIAVATDSRATRFDQEGPDRILTVQKIYPLGTHAFVLSAGMGIGLPLSRSLQTFIQRRKIQQAEQILGFAGRFLTQHHQGILPSGGDRAPEDALERLFFLIGGTPCRGPVNPYRMILLASEKGHQPLEEHEVHHCLTIPRSLGIEIRLHRMCLNESPLEEILTLAKDFLLSRAREDDSVGPPFHWALLTAEGLRMGQWTEEIPTGP